MQRCLLVVGTAWVILGILPASALAQDAARSETASHDAPSQARVDAAVDRGFAPAPSLDAQVEMAAVRPASRGPLVPLYISAAALQMMDVHSTRRALALGHAEGNPFMSGIASNTPAFVAVKAATAASVILLSEKLRKRNRVAAIGLMVAVNAATAAVVAHNYRVAR